MSTLPFPLRAAIGLAATMLDEARSLPDKAIELPMLAVSRALQLTLRAQQRYTALAARGDAVLSGRSVSDDPPPWARFDEPVEDGAASQSSQSPDEPVDPVTAKPDPPKESNTGKPSRPRARPNKTVRVPRTGTPSAFDAVTDEV